MCVYIHSALQKYSSPLAFFLFCCITTCSIFIFGEKKVPVLNRIFCQDKMLEYAYNWQLRIENTKVSKTVKNIVCEYNRTDIAGENLRKI